MLSPGRTRPVGINLLSVEAAYGLLVLVFQEGIGNELLGLREAETIDAWVPLFLFAVLFGLSMDYQVFLLSRIRERYAQTGDTDAAISFGIGSTARLITGAALQTQRRDVVISPAIASSL
ncbi:MAG: MMPL family transporter [Gaiellaceae bacterium]